MAYSATEVQRQVYDFVVAYSLDHGGLTPTYQEIMEFMGLRSKSGVARILRGLRDRGLIDIMHHKHRCIEIRDLKANDAVVQIDSSLMTVIRSQAKQKGVSVATEINDILRGAIYTGPRLVKHH